MDEHTLAPHPPLSAAPAALSASGRVELSEWRHSLLALDGPLAGRRIDIVERPLVMGRRNAADLVLPELQVSALHCRVQSEAGRAALRVTDLKSTNGTFVNGRRVEGSVYLAPGCILAVGSHRFRHEFLSPDDQVRAAYEAAAREQTVAAWLPAAVISSALRTGSCYRPADPPRGAGAAVLPLEGNRVALVLIDVGGPREHVQRQAARLLRELRGLRDLGNLAGPAALFAQWHAQWRDVAGDGLFFTAWAGVYDPATRVLTHANAGQHPALLRQPDADMLRLDALNPPIGLLPEADFTEAHFVVPPGSRLHLFNKGAFDVTVRNGRQLEFDDFEALLACLPPGGGQAAEQAFLQLRGLTATEALDDDFLLLQADFPG